MINKTLAISTIALVAVVMGMSTIAPAIAAGPPMVYAGGCDPKADFSCVGIDRDGDGTCEVKFQIPQHVALRLLGPEPARPVCT